ncbi:SCP2 sterol-binding domain-containing protein [Mesorhizobium sp. VK25A]|uniref:SCP2 sterol-binding domain-containing protein n=1 Tax=Mesorhizobium vachelliae TaxID=3072309 RepID=A0ABU5AEB4_9HYPH|nr:MULTISPECIES: SCP2 sterol-binding domain-containing protein [unclassified Mesorhizobium]MDX8535619.1 SCP2 sterol-binding domain-containing protein [Mesorhizobium sp. VK25D]MDX8548372.1 SCP2 sterol-binding domain-containing protein [Mesorhizobium sp. VK25A]
MRPQDTRTTLPGFVRHLFPTVAGLPLGPLLTLSLRSLARRRPGLFERLGESRSACFGIDPVDLAFAFCVVPDGQRSSVRVVSKDEAARSDVQVKGPLLTLLGLLDGTLDGDAMFFSRVISISGRTEAVLALRNTIEDAELRPADLLGLHGILARCVDTGVLGALGVARRLADNNTSETQEA